VSAAVVTDLHETPMPPDDPQARAALQGGAGGSAGSRLTVRLRPFQVLTVRLTPAG
jgi:hypothetical protein